MANTARAGQIIQHNNNIAQAADETLGPCFQDYILYNMIQDIDPRLTKHIKTHYKLKIAAGQRLTDLKSDIFTNIPKFLEEIQQQESLNALRAQASTLASLQQQTVAPQWTSPLTSTVQGTDPPLPAVISQPPPPIYTAQGLDTTNRYLQHQPDTASLAAFARYSQPELSLTSTVQQY